jgi:chromosome segregation ATPase
MLDAFGIGSSPKKPQKAAAEDLQALIKTAREERSALSEMLTQVSVRSQKLTQTQKALEQVEKTALGSNAKIDELARRLDERTKGMDEVDAAVKSLVATAQQVQQAAAWILSPDGDLQKHREAVAQLFSQTDAARADMEALAQERASLTDLRTQLHQTREELNQSFTYSDTLKEDLGQLRATASILTQDCTSLRDVAREVREDSKAAMEGVRDIETRLGPLAQLNELGRNTEERMASLNALAEYVTHKVKALESQKHTIDHAVVQANRLNEMVWAMESQIAKLNEGNKQVTRIEENLAAMERLAADTTSQLDTAARAKDELAREIARVEKDGQALSESVRGHLDKLSVEKREFEAFDQRLRLLQTAVAEAENRMEALATADTHVTQVKERAEALGKRFQELALQGDELYKQHEAVQALHTRLDQVDELSKRTNSQLVALNQSRRDVEALRREIAEFHKAHGEAAQLREKLGADRAALGPFIERVTALNARAPGMTASMDAIEARFGVIEDCAQKASRLAETVQELDGQLTRVSARAAFVEQVEARINGLSTVLADVERQAAEQTARRAELDAIRTQIDTLHGLTIDAQQKLDAVGTLQRRLLPMTEQLANLRSEIDQTASRLNAVAREEAAIAEQETRLTGLMTATEQIAREVDDRQRQVQNLAEELNRAASLKTELAAELAQVQTGQRETVAQIDASDDQLKRVETLFTQLEQRTSQLVFAERAISTFEGRIAELKELTELVDRKIDDIGNKQAVVAAVRQQVESVHDIGASSKADLQYVAEHRVELDSIKQSVDEVLSQMAQTDEKLALIMSRKKLVDEVEVKTQMINNLLTDVRLNLETLGEQKELVDHMAGQLAKLEFMTQEAQNTLRTLQRERELAERIEHGVKKLRSRSSAVQGRPASN